MFLKKTHVIIGLTTYYNEYLELSIPALSRLEQNFTLVIHNDNPQSRVTTRMIRRLGYKGVLHIINSAHNVGMLMSRMAILDYVRSRGLRSEWFVFADDDDFITSLKIPDVSKDNFAILQNMAVVRTRLIDVLRIAKDTENYTIDNENIFLVRPHIGMAGTLVRFNAIMRLCDILHRMQSAISDIDASLSYRPPVDMMMWSVLNIVSRHDNEYASPIYMDTVNYIATDIDCVTSKYGMLVQPAKNPAAQIAHAISKYDAAARCVLASMDDGVSTDDADGASVAAAPVGQEAGE